jgi:hydroxymethylpyrimidine pyrophosphatase-like HAD family hydrolase
MDGTLLDSSSRVLPSSVDAIRAALGRGVTVVLATGKARPAAIKAMRAVGLAGEGLVVSRGGPGIFLQGLTVYGAGGALIGGGSLPPEVVRAAWAYSAAAGVALCGFLGETCVTPGMTPEIRSLHDRYYEPLADVAPSVDRVLAGPPLRKLLFMTTAARVDAEVRPHWEAALAAGGGAAATMQAVPDMLEVVPAGWDKWAAMQRLLRHLGVPREALMAVGDGGNDLTLVRNAGLGVAMGNAVGEVRAAAAATVASNDEGGVAEAIERYIL